MGTVPVEEQNLLAVMLKGQNGNILASRAVSITDNGVSYANLTTGSNGQVSFNWSPSKTGDYTLGASYSALGSMDTGYMPASASTIVNVKPQTIINTQTTGSGTQSVTFNTAQGSTQTSTLLPSISISFPDPFTIAVSIHYNGKTAQASSHLTNAFGIHCSWYGCWPYWNVNIDASVSGMFSLHITGPGIGIATGASVTISTAPPSDDLAFEAGATVSAVIASSAILTLASSDIASISTVLIGIPIAIGAGADFLANGGASSYRSYLLGLLLPPLLAIPCLFLACPVTPDVLGFALLTAAFVWLNWEEVMFRVLWTLGGFLAALVLGIVIVAGSLLVTLL